MVADKHFQHHRKWTRCILKAVMSYSHNNNNNEYLEHLICTGPKHLHVLYKYILSKFNAYNMNAHTHIKKLWLCYVISGNERKIVWRRIQTNKIKLKCPPVLPQFPAQTLCKFSYFINLELTLGIKFIFITSLLHLFWKVRFVKKQRHLNLKKYLNVYKT